MNKLFRIKPYSFRSRLLLFLLLAALVSCIISAAGSFMVDIVNISNDLKANQQEAAISLLSLQQKTTLDTAEMLSMSAGDYLECSIVQRPERLLSDQQLQRLTEGNLVVTTSGLTSMPRTYLLLNNDVVGITTSRDFNLLLSVLPRVIFTLALTLTLFVLLSILVSFTITRPVTQLTQATRQIRDGDFSVRLPEDKLGEIGDLMKSFNSMTETLSRTAYLQKDFISNISHEFRTPIASIKGFARLLQTPGLDEASRCEYTDMIARESDRLSRLSDTLLRLSALEQQIAPASLSTYRLDEQVREVILQLEPAWSARDIDLQLNLDPVTIESDAELLVQVWINLIQNAIKFSPSGSTISISVSGLDQAQFTITDQGSGMSEETLARIFDRFYQGDESRSKEGVGLGLCLVKRIVDMLDGEIRVRSSVGAGSTFRIRLPLRTKGGNHEQPTARGSANH